MGERFMLKNFLMWMKNTVDEKIVVELQWADITETGNPEELKIEGVDSSGQYYCSITSQGPDISEGIYAKETWLTDCGYEFHVHKESVKVFRNEEVLRGI